MRPLILFGFLALGVGTFGCAKKDDPGPQAKDPNKGVVFDKPKEPPPEPPPPPPDILQAKNKPAPKGLVQSVRAAAYRPERLNELRNIAMFFNQYALENNRNPKSDEEFIQYIQRDAPKIAEAVKDKYYILNLKAKSLSSESVIAYESQTEANGHQTVRGDASVSLMAPDDLRKMLMQ